jgi:hypothetical protein
MQNVILSHDSVTPLSQDANNATNTITLNAVAGQKYGLNKLSVNVSGVAATAAITVTVTDNATVIYKGGLAGELGSTLNEDWLIALMQSTRGNAMTIVASASGAAGSIVTLNIQYLMSSE